MEWVLFNPQVQSVFGSLGYQRDGIYHINDDCLPILDAIYNKLLSDDATSCIFRKAIGLGQNITNDLIPLLIFTKNWKILEKVTKILVNLTMPVECLLPLDNISQSLSGHNSLFELNNLLAKAKNSFVNNNSTRAIIEFIKEIIEKSNDKFTPEDCLTINNCLLLIRNILNIPEKSKNKKALAKSSVQNQILWNLFTGGIDRLLINLMTSAQSSYWSVAIVQLIALLYKDQAVNALQKLLNVSLDSLSESSDDNESNTSPTNRGSDEQESLEQNSDLSDGNTTATNKQKVESLPNDQRPFKRCIGYDVSDDISRPKKCKTLKRKTSSSDACSVQDAINISNKLYFPQNDFSGKEDPFLPSSETSLMDYKTTLSSDFGSIKEKKVPHCSRKRHKIVNSPSSDLGYGTQIEATGSLSASSTDDGEQTTAPVHNKPQNSHKQMPTKKFVTKRTQEKNELRRKKIIKRGKSAKITMKALANHAPTDEHIAYALKEFTVDFLLKGYNRLVQNLHQVLITNLEIQIDTSHFFWLITYFLKFATHLEIDLKHIGFVLSYDVLSFITSEGVNLCEQLEMFKQSGCNLKPCIRRMHLVVTAVKEFMQAIESYKHFTHLSEEEQNNLNHVKLSICHTRELRCFFVMLLRLYHPKLQAKQYLKDLIITNHLLLIMLDNGILNLEQHLKQFATVTAVGHYGLLLEDFRKNGEMVNDCIFTMLYHISGKLNCLSLLFQPSILKVFSEMRETDYELREQWSGLIDWTLRVSTKNPSSETSYCYVVHTPKLKSPLSCGTNESEQESWSQKDAQLLSWYYRQSLQCEDVIKNIINLYSQSYSTKTKSSVIKQLHLQNIIDKSEYDILTNKEELIYDDVIPKSSAEKAKTDVTVLCNKLKLTNISYNWVQAALLEACYTKSAIAANVTTSGDTSNATLNISPHVNLEPVPFYHVCTNQSIPIVPWNSDHELASNNPVFQQLMKYLGLYLPSDTGKYYIRIPNFWTSKVIFETVLKLGAVDLKHTSLNNNLDLTIEKPNCVATDDVQMDITNLTALQPSEASTLQ